MKREFYKIAKTNGFEFIFYRTYKSFTGCQCYHIEGSNGKRFFVFNDSYSIGSGEIEKQNVLKRFSNLLKKGWK